MALELKNIKGLRTMDLTNLRENGIVDINYLASATIHELEAIGFGKDRAQRIIEEAGKILDEFMGAKDGFLMGTDLIKQYSKMERLSTGSPSFDKILGGGFETQKVYEVYGKEKSGKSRLCHQLVVRAHLSKEKGGLGSPAAVYIDTEGTFNMKTLKTMAQYVGLDPEMVSKNLAYSKPPTSGTLNYIIWKHLPKIMEQTGARIVILDSIATHFRAEYGIARQLLPERQMRANQVIHNLKKAATKFNALIVMTNQAVANVSGYGAPYNHAMGLVVGHESQVRIRIQKKSGPEREIMIEKAIDLPEDTCKLDMTEFGFEEQKEKKKKGKKKIKEEEESEEQEEESTEEEIVENEVEPELESDVNGEKETTAKVTKTKKAKKAKKKATKSESS